VYDGIYNCVTLFEFTFSYEVAGIFTERDYLYKLILEGKTSKATPVKDVMTPNVSVAYSSFDLEKCSRLIATSGKRHLPVCEGEETNCTEVIGMISAKDIVKQIAKLSEKFFVPVLTERVADVFDFLARTSSQQCYISKSGTVFAALQLMRKHKIGGLWVTDDQKLSGIFTERDYLNNIILKGRSSKTTLVEEAMSKNVQFVDPSTLVRDCIKLMANNDFQTMPVMPMLGDDINDQERDSPIGLITSMDVIKFLESESSVL